MFEAALSIFASNGVIALSRVYANFRILLVLSTIFLLSGCGGGNLPWGSYNLPWESATDFSGGVNNPSAAPDIGWQTPDQRRILTKREVVLSPQPPVQEEQVRRPSGIFVSTPQPVDVARVISLDGGVTISLLLPLSGKKSELGQSMLKAAQMALFDVGSTGFRMIPRDTKSTAEGAAAAAKAAVQNNDNLILGPIFAEDLKAVKPVVRASGTPVISFTTDWTLADGNTYIMGFLPFTQVARVTRYAQSQGYSKLSIYAPETEYCDVVIRTLQRIGVSITHVRRYPSGQTDLLALVQEFADDSQDFSAINQLNFDMLMLPLGSEGLRTLATILETSGIDQTKVKFLGTGLWDDAVLTRDPALFGGWFAAPDPRMRKGFERRFRKNYGEQPLRLSSLAYDATALAAVLARSRQNSGLSPYDRNTLANQRGFSGIDGIFRFRTDGLSERGLAVLEIQSGKTVVVDRAPTAFILSGS